MTWGEKPAYLKPHTSDVVSAVESLYVDMLKPFGRILLKRVREAEAARQTEQARAAGDKAANVDIDSVPLIDPKCLRKVCESCTNLRVEPEDGKEYSVLLLGRERNFVDVCSPADAYPPEMWAKAGEYFEGLQGEDMLLPGGRYACAQVLLARELQFLEGRSLGEVCHIVQLAVSQKRILGYLEGNMVPFGRSVDYIKEQCAFFEQPVTFAKKTTPDMPLATWEEARACLWEILERASLHGQPGVITLSNVKRLFRSRFSLELSETALGHSRLNELLQDPRFGDICSLELQGKSQVVVQHRPSSVLLEDLVQDPAACADFWQQASTWDSREPFLEHTPLELSPPRALDPLATPWTPSQPPAADSFVCLSTNPLLSEPPAPTPLDAVQEEATASVVRHSSTESRRSSTEILAGYVQKLLELGHEEKVDVVEALTAPWQATSSEEANTVSAAAVAGTPGAPAAGIAAVDAKTPTKKAGDHSRRSSLSASRSTSDEGSVTRDSDGDQEDSDADGNISAVSSTEKGNKGLSAEAQEFVMPPVLPMRKIPLPPGLAPPPGLSF